MDDEAYEEKLLLLTKAMEKENREAVQEVRRLVQTKVDLQGDVDRLQRELQEAQLRALKAEAEVERLKEKIEQQRWQIASLQQKEKYGG